MKKYGRKANGPFMRGAGNIIKNFLLSKWKTINNQEVGRKKKHQTRQIT